MIYGVYALRDKKSSWLPPMTDVSDDSAIRNFGNAVNWCSADKMSNMYLHPDDFELYKLGTYSDVTGEITLLDHHEFLVDGVSLKKSVDNKEV